VPDVPEVLRVAREARAEGNRGISPSRLWDLAGGDKELYRHAMIEVGHVVPREVDGKPNDEIPYSVCPLCGFEF
jgi:hypothetical protein